MAKIIANNFQLYSKDSFLLLDADLRSKKDFVMPCIRRNGLLYDCLSPELKNDKDIIIEAFTQDNEVFDSIPDVYKNDLDFLISLTLIDGLIVDKFKPEFQDNKKIILTAISSIGVDALWNKSITVYQDPEIMIAALNSPYGQQSWEPILTAAGDEAEFSKLIIELAYSIFGETLLEHDLTWIRSESRIREAFNLAYPRLAHLFL